MRERGLEEERSGFVSKNETGGEDGEKCDVVGNVRECSSPMSPIVKPTGFRLRARSKTATRVPGAARSIANAADKPAGPPPTIATSTSLREGDDEFAIVALALLQAFWC